MVVGLTIGRPCTCVTTESAHPAQALRRVYEREGGVDHRLQHRISELRLGSATHAPPSHARIRGRKMPKHTWMPSTSRPTRGFGRLRGMSRRAHLDKAQPSQVHGVHGTPSLLLGLAGTSARPLASHPRSSLPAWPWKRGRVVLASVAWKTTTVRPATYVWSGVHSSRLDRLTAIRSTETNSSERDGFDSEDVLHVSVACCVEPHRPVQTNADIFVSEARSGSWTGLSQSWPTCLAAGGRRTWASRPRRRSSSAEASKDRPPCSRMRYWKCRPTATACFIVL